MEGCQNLCTSHNVFQPDCFSVSSSRCVIIGSFLYPSVCFSFSFLWIHISSHAGPLHCTLQCFFLFSVLQHWSTQSCTIWTNIMQLYENVWTFLVKKITLKQHLYRCVLWIEEENVHLIKKKILEAHIPQSVKELKKKRCWMLQEVMLFYDDLFIFLHHVNLCMSHITFHLY